MALTERLKETLDDVVQQDILAPATTQPTPWIGSCQIRRGRGQGHSQDLEKGGINAAHV